MVRLATIRDEATDAQINNNAIAMSDSRAGASYLFEFYLEPREGRNAAAAAVVMMNEDPTLLRQTAIPLAKQHTDTMVAEVAADAEGVYKAVPEVYAVAVAGKFIGNDDYKAGKEANRTGNGIGAAFTALHPGKSILANMITIASPSAVQKGLEDTLTRIRITEFAANNITKTDGTINRAGTAKYDAAQVGALGADEKKAYYAEAGNVYAKDQDDTHFGE